MSANRDDAGSELERRIVELEQRLQATSDILRVISQSPTDVQPVFDAIVLASVRRLGCDMAFLLRCDATGFIPVAMATPEGLPTEFGARQPIDPGANLPSRAIIERKTQHIPDFSLVELPDYDRRVHEIYGINSALFLPLLRAGECIGLLALAGKRACMFGDSEIALAESFRDQALIAIENVRLFNETQEALERQTATAEILKVIASSPSDVQPVFEAIAERSNRLVNGLSTAVYSIVDDTMHLMAFTRTSPEADAALQASFPRPLSDAAWGDQIRRCEIVEIPDADAEWAELPSLRELARLRGFRSLLFVPLLRDRTLIGIISVTRVESGLFAAHHVHLLQTFADQAVIAIENTRLFNETKESLERQTATAEILNVIASSPTDTQPVFDVIARSATELCEGMNSGVYLLQNGLVHVAGHHNVSPEQLAFAQTAFPTPPHRGIMSGRAILDRAVAHVADIAADPEYTAQSMVKAGFRSAISVPMLRNGEPIGAINVTREEARPFSDRQIELLRSFADQAVIAIQNTWLFNETNEALERQTATAEILKVIASSPSDVQPVFDAIAESARRLLAGHTALVTRVAGDMIDLAAFTAGSEAGNKELQSSFPAPLSSPGIHSRVARTAELAFRTDIENEPDVPQAVRDMARARGYRSIIVVPMLREGVSIGTIGVARREPGPFSSSHVDLLGTFADQAIIAIENARLFNETREALERQTATADILKVIARSPSDVQPVFEAIAASANRLFGGFSTAVFRFVDGASHLAAFTPTNPAADEMLKASFPRPVAGFQPLESANMGEPVQIVDTEVAEARIRDIARARGFRSMLFSPLMSNGESIGVISVTRLQPGAFAAHHVQLLQTFADQAVIAIENVRLFDEVQARTRDLSESLQQQTATADVLKVISRSAFDLQTVLETLTRSAVELSGARRGVIFLRDGDLFRFQAMSYANVNPEWIQFLREHPQKAGQNSAIARSIASGQIVCVPDVLADPQIDMPATALAGIRAVLAVPLLRDGKVEGVLALSRPTAGPFNARQIDLVQTFADQAVIAVENVRLFEQVQARTKELSQSLNELRTAQDRLVQTEKLASLGQLTAGIAHEIKNPLNFVNNFSALSAELTDELNDVLKSVALSEKTREEVDEITGLLKANLEKVVQHGKRADSIVKNMLLHSREGSGEQRPADVNALVEESLNLAYHGARAEKPEFNVTMKRDLDPHAGIIEAFPQEMTRVLLNLISNGFYAVTKRKADNGEGGFEPVVTATTKGAIDHVEIRIRDNGTGIPPDVKEKMFNPFFTTKPAGEGTGLGLSMSHDIIVKQHGGTIDVDTTPGEFTEFTIVLPRTSNLSNKARG